MAYKKNDPALQEIQNFLKEVGDSDPHVSLRAQDKLASAMVEAINGTLSLGDEKEESLSVNVDVPIREGVLDGDIHSDIFVQEDFTLTQDLRIPLDFLAPGTEKEHIAYVMPDHGGIPYRRVEADYILLNTYTVASSIDCTRRFFRNNRVDILRRMIEVLRTDFIKKDNDDAWQTLLAAVDSRGLVVFDPDAAAGQFTPKLVNLAKITMRRNGGGNSTSTNRRRLTDMYISPEGLADMTSWGLNLIPDELRAQIHRSSTGSLMGLYDVNFHDIDELGEGQQYQDYYEDVLGGSLEGSDVELAVGLDLTQRDKAFINPITEDLQIWPDETVHRQQLVSFYGIKEPGWAVLDTRFVLAASF